LTAQLPQLIRQDVRRRLSVALTEKEPGLASYYAERAGLSDQAEGLLKKHQARLVKDNTFKDHSRRGSASSRVQTISTALRVAEPGRILDESRRSVSHQGYSVSLEGGWLNVMSDGRYGHPQTLTLRLTWQEPLKQELRLVWRLDVFSGGEELHPSQAAFPLRLTPIYTGGMKANAPASVFGLQIGEAYREHQRPHEMQPGVELGQWLEHRLGGTTWQGSTGVEISVRALDVALTIGVIDTGDVIGSADYFSKRVKV